jgi:hypothetical protein
MYRIACFELNELAGSVAQDAQVYGVGLDAMRQVLEKYDYQTSLKSTLRGISGALQSFDIVAMKDNVTIVIDILPSADRKKSVSALINIRAKMWDCAPELGIVVSPVKPSEEMKEMARFYKLKFVEALNETELEVKFEDLIASLNRESEIPDTLATVIERRKFDGLN